MKILGLEHVGIAVESDEKSRAVWETLLGLTASGKETVEGQGVATTIYPVGGSKLETLNSIKPDSPVGRFLKKSGPGIHHLCFEVDDINSAIKELKGKGLRVIYENPQTGVEGFVVTFLHPKDTGGVLVELAQKMQG